MKKIAFVVGARPNFIKLAPILEAIKSEQLPIRPILIHTGQHYDTLMSDVFFRELRLPKPHVHLAAGSGTHAVQTSRILIGLEEIFRAKRPDGVVVFGDVNSTLAGALAAVKLHIPVAHVESGIRSFNRSMPEEINRIMTDRVADLMFCPTVTGVQNLKKEGIRKGVSFTGDTMFEMAFRGLRLARERSRALAEHELRPRGFCLATLHRAGNTDDPERLRGIFDALHASGELILLPLHPRTRAKLPKNLKTRRGSGLRLVDPVPYLDMLILESNAKAILTDSGGVQKEAFWFNVPCLVLRDDTEWRETLRPGRNRLTGADPKKILRALRSISASRRLPSAKAISSKLYYGTGAGRRIARLIAQKLGV